MRNLCWVNIIYQGESRSLSLEQIILKNPVHATFASPSAFPEQKTHAVVGAKMTEQQTAALLPSLSLCLLTKGLWPPLHSLNSY